MVFVLHTWYIFIRFIPTFFIYTFVTDPQFLNVSCNFVPM